MKDQWLHRMVVVVISLPLLVLAGCQSLRDFRGVGPMVDPVAMHYRLYDIALPLLIAATDACPFAIESTYGFFLRDPDGPHAEPPATTSPPTVAHVHPKLAAASAGLIAGDRITQVNVQSVQGRSGEEVMALIRRLTAARIQPLQLDIERDGSSRTIVMRAVPACQYQLQVIQNDYINGVSNGRQIGVTSGAMWAFPWDDELASIVAHEIAHNILGHADDARLRATLNAFQQATMGTGPTSEPDPRSLESQADYVGVYLMARAGYDLDGIRRVWTKLRTIEAQQGSAMTQMAHNHPTTGERYAAFEATLKEIEERQRRGEALIPRLGATQ